MEVVINQQFHQEEFLGLSSLKEINEKFKSFRRKDNHFCTQMKEDISVVKQRDKGVKFKEQKQNLLKIVNTKALSTERLGSLQAAQLNPCTHKSTSYSVTQDSSEVKVKEDICKKSTKLVNFRDQFRKYQSVNDFLWFVDKIVKSSKKYDFNEDQNLFKQLGIDIKKLNDTQSIEQRQDYIAKCLQQQLQKDMITLQEQHKQSAKLFEDQDEIQKNQFEKKYDQSNHTVIDWMRLGRKFSHLEKKAKLCLVENIHEFNNAESIRNHLNKQIEISKNNSPSTKPMKKITLNIRKLKNKSQDEEELNQLKKEFAWTPSTESIFKCSRDEMRAKLSRKLTSSNWQSQSLQN